MIKAILTSFAALVLVAGAASHADAANQKKKRQHAGHYNIQPSPKSTYGYRSHASGNGSGNGSGDYYEHLLDKVPFGSKKWWSIYEEQHGAPDG
jgi:ABC-type oligopeptide transport system substrate-binding subunit